MTANKKSFSFASSSGLSDIYACKYTPTDSITPKAVIQIAHGMAEHHERYEDFIEFLTTNGYIVYINDHLGHGRSVSHISELGFFGNENGYLYLVEDMKNLTEIAKSENPDLPVILFGHSMGSMLSRLYTEKYGCLINGVIYCGTTGANPAATAGIAIIKAITKFKGDHHRSDFINNLAFGTYNKKTAKRTTFDWLTTVDSIVDKYIADPLCGFLFTTNGYRDLLTLMLVISRNDWYTSVPLDLPIYLIAGDEDPVGAYGKGVKSVYQGLIDTKHADVTLKMFSGDRHEILNEKDKADVYNCVVQWIDTIL